jgi:hypothetical protein
MIDVNDPANTVVIGTLPRPTPPADAPFTDYCQRKGSFGPKRTGYYTQPGVSRPGVVPYAFYNAGVQIFDVSDSSAPTIAAYFVPRFDTERVPEYARRSRCSRCRSPTSSIGGDGRGRRPCSWWPARHSSCRFRARWATARSTL